MSAPDWLTESQRAAWERGAEQARADCAKAEARTTMDVSVDVGGGQRRHVAWCLTCSGPAERCRCGHDAAALVEDPVDVEADITSLIAESREQLRLHADAAIGIIDVPTGGRL